MSALTGCGSRKTAARHVLVNLTNLTRQSCLLRRLAAPLSLLLLAACAAGPNFKRPAAPQVSDYTAHPQSSTVATADTAGGAAQRFAKGGDLAGDWWTLFHSAALNALIDQSLERNPDLKAAQAALSVARENVLAQRGVYYPSDVGQCALGALGPSGPSRSPPGRQVRFG